MEMTVQSAQLLRTFERLPLAMRKKVAVKAMRAGAKVVVKKAVANIRSMESSEASGVMAKSVQAAKFRDKNGMIRFGVRIKPKAVNARKKDRDGKPVRVGLYASVFNWGKKGQPGRPWLTNAAKASPAEVVSAAREEFDRGLNEAVQDART